MNLDYLNELLKKYSIKEIANKLNIASGTIKRWIELNEIPKNYEFDLLKLSNISIDYSKYSSKEKDQFYTPKETAEECFNIFLIIIGNYEKDRNLKRRKMLVRDVVCKGKLY